MTKQLWFAVSLVIDVYKRQGYRFQSFGEDKALLATYNICAEEVKGEVNGKPDQGIVYSAINDKGEKVGNPVKASRIGKSVGYEAVQRRMEKSGEAIKNGKRCV